MSIAWTRLPFRFGDAADYATKLSSWIAEVFYERLPAAGYQVREEQIYLSFRIAAALAAGRPILAEGGSGTGKTFAYLLPAVCHARLRGMPVIISTATAALQEQLAGDEGDVQALSRILGLEVDARLATPAEEAVCDVRAERLRSRGGRAPGRAALLRWWSSSAHGNRREYPAATDALWSEVAWTPACRCEVCPRRGYCRLMKGRAHARQATDLIIARHDAFLADVWARRRGLSSLPAFPPHAAVVFDEGHRVALAAQRAGGWSFVPDRLAAVLRGVEGEGARLRLLRLAEAAEGAAVAFAAEFTACTEGDEAAERRLVRRSEELGRAAARLAGLLRRLQDEMAVEEGLHEETAYGVRLEGSQWILDAARGTLDAMADDRSVIWREGSALWAVPRDLAPLWGASSSAAPPVFSSATLAAGGDFSYTSRRLGLKAPLQAQVGVPFRLAQNVLCYLPGGGPRPGEPGFWPEAAKRLARLCEATGGRTLILACGRPDLDALRAYWTWQGATLWEGDGGAAALLRTFASHVGSVLVGHTLWEGVDVPGDALSAVAVPVLPLPGEDPPIIAEREDAQALGLAPFLAVDVPAMAIRLRQGLGRLIRSETDRGVMAVLDPRGCGGGPLAAAVSAALPDGARRVRTLPPVRRFLEAGG